MDNEEDNKNLSDSNELEFNDNPWINRICPKCHSYMKEYDQLAIMMDPELFGVFKCPLCGFIRAL